MAIYASLTLRFMMRHMPADGPATLLLLRYAMLPLR